VSELRDHTGQGIGPEVGGGAHDAPREEGHRRYDTPQRLEGEGKVLGDASLAAVWEWSFLHDRRVEPVAQAHRLALVGDHDTHGLDVGRPEARQLDEDPITPLKLAPCADMETM